MMTTAIASNNLGFPKAMPLEVRVMKIISTFLRIYSTWLVMINKHVVGQQYGSTKKKRAPFSRAHSRIVWSGSHSKGIDEKHRGWLEAS